VEVVAAWTADPGFEGCDGGGFHAGPEQDEFAVEELPVEPNGGGGGVAVGKAGPLVLPLEVLEGLYL
jgi:hypothetical protein